MGLPKKSPVEQPLVNKMISLLQIGGYEVIFPKDMDKLCCGTIWESKGMLDIADRKAAELEAAAAKDPGLKPLLIPDGGFYWRRIAGETCLSPHSFGIAIDLNTKYATYWKWQKNPDAPHPQQTSYPSVIVKAFEDNGFIWGGKWHRFDIMHFEYRPEIILQAKKKAVEAEPCVPVRESGSGAEKKESAPLPE